MKHTDHTSIFTEQPLMVFVRELSAPENLMLTDDVKSKDMQSTSTSDFLIQTFP